MDSEIIARILAVDIPAEKKIEILAILNARPERSKAAERMARYRAKRHECVTGDVTRDATEVTPPSPPPLSPLHPPLPAPTPVQVREARAHEGQELFGDPPPAPPAPLPPHKRIAWTPKDGWQGITAEDRIRFALSAPACDLDRQLSSADLWLRANPAKARKSNFYRFFASWLTKQQDRGGDAASNRPSQKPAPSATPYGPVQPNKWQLPDYDNDPEYAREP